jgi:hypothetical protein
VTVSDFKGHNRHQRRADAVHAQLWPAHGLSLLLPCHNQAASPPHLVHRGSILQRASRGCLDDGPVCQWI